MANDRLFYLDHLRAFAMLFGVLVHTATLQTFGPALEAIPTVSFYFRMGTFFAVSGYFGALLLSRRNVATFLRSRVQALGIPLVFGLLVLNPLTFVLIDRFPESGDHFAWHLHLWFLVSLLCYTCMAPLLLRLIPALPVPSIPPVLQPVAVALAVTLAVVALRAVFAVALEPLGAPWLVRTTLAYAPYYAMGLVLFRHPQLWARLHRVDPLLIGLAALAWLPDGGTLLDIVKRELTVCAAFFALLWAFRRLWDFHSPVGGAISNAAYTIYLFHFLFIYLIGNLAVGAFPVGAPWFFALVCTATMAATFAIHVGLVRRSRIVSFVVNGK